ncbi:fibronectin type III domain-containing protein [Butyrivibrio sp. MB2005]|uniref:fibronectin type III domain-containing protein n=1 Tax=Butyrivibrio sp. MB2005 TaxID=1280678 RepID=UPI0004205ACE|nr:fibronectin type III domain-containing protein [Butyrivibrio sp. MB2005]
MAPGTESVYVTAWSGDGNNAYGPYYDCFDLHVLADGEQSSGSTQGSSSSEDGNSQPSTQPSGSSQNSTAQDIKESDESANVDSSVPTPKKLSVKADGKKATIKWKKQTKNTKGYEIQYSTDRNFKDNVKKTSVKKSATSKTIKKLKAGKTYYVRIRTKYKKDGKTVYSEWSKVKKVKISK